MSCKTKIILQLIREHGLTENDALKVYLALTDKKLITKTYLHGCRISARRLRRDGIQLAALLLT
jgi:hypothetical protein